MDIMEGIVTMGIMDTMDTIITTTDTLPLEEVITDDIQ